ncbi:hypothetical protein M9H77_21594 [Catharanthus roseus]|uniref:Uncharacterized protein n=1 Tax=Catharanthus roseus TaxID=4058 RepID=A0ACC0ANS6_CATRO|nr:hypothetical protein M9H77_21594 [Catharanthus roseus]
MIKVNCRVTGCHQVVRVIREYNHSLCSPSKIHLFRSHRSLSSVQAAEADMARSVEITPKATIDFMSKQVGGLENLGFIPQDYKDYVHSKCISEMKAEDTGGILEYLQKK